MDDLLSDRGRLLVANFKSHKNDPLCFAISALTRSPYTHSALVTHEKRRLITEAFWPCVRTRALTPDEIDGIDFFEIRHLSLKQELGMRSYLNKVLGCRTHYSIANLLRFLPFMRPILGEAHDIDANSPVFCDQLVLDTVDRGTLAAGEHWPLLNANSWEVSPGQVPWSPLLRKTELR